MEQLLSELFKKYNIDVTQQQIDSLIMFYNLVI